MLFSNSCEENDEVSYDFPIPGEWILKSLKDLTTEKVEIKPESIPEMIVYFFESGKLSVASSCNYFYGNYKVDRSASIEIYDLVTTLMLCTNEERMTWEDKFFHGLKNSSQYRLDKKTMVIITSTKMELNFVLE